MEQQFDQDPQWLKRLMREDDGFNVPDGYFDSLENRVMQRISEHGIQRPVALQPARQKAKKLQLRWLLPAVAAALALILTAVWFFRPAPVPAAPLVSVELSEEDIESFVIEHVQDFDAEQLAMLPEEEAQNEPEIPTQTPSSDSLNDITPDDVNSILNDMTEEELEDIL